MANFFDTGGSSQARQAPGPSGPPDPVNCPPVTVRLGTSTLLFHASREQTPLTLRYQTTIGRTARDCKVVGNQMVMTIGVEGRVILGPAGGPGKLEIPMRFGVVEEGPNPKPIISKFHLIPVTVEGNQGNVPFVKIDEDFAFPMAPVDRLERYVVYVGFDPDGLRTEPRRRRSGRR